MHKIVGGILIASLFGLAGTANASLYSHINWSSFTNWTSVTVVPADLYVYDNSFLSVSDPLIAGLGFATVQTDYGIQKAAVDTFSYFANPPGSGGGAFYESSVTTESKWSDTITFLGGTGSGTLTAYMLIDGTLGTVPAANPSESAEATLFFNFTAPYGYTQSAEYVADSSGSTTITGGTFQNNVLSTVWTFDYNTPYDITSDFFLQGSFGGYGHFGDTLALSFDLPDGTMINSANGASYAIGAPVTVPEPGTIALFGIGLAGLGFSRRRKRA